jgi:hypothetical protein
MSEQPVNGFVRCNGCGFDYHVSVKHDCPVPAAPTETREPEDELQAYLVTREWAPDSLYPGYESRINEEGYLQTRPSTQREEASRDTQAATQDYTAMREARDRALEALREAADELINYQIRPLARILRARRTIDHFLANPASRLSPAPERRHQLRNWHHVTCSNFGGGACTCLAAREALIADLAKPAY